MSVTHVLPVQPYQDYGTGMMRSSVQVAITNRQGGEAEGLTKFRPERKQAGHLDEPIDPPDDAHDLKVVSREGPRGQAGTAAAVDEFDCRHLSRSCLITSRPGASTRTARRSKPFLYYGLGSHYLSGHRPVLLFLFEVLFVNLLPEWSEKGTINILRQNRANRVRWKFVSTIRYISNKSTWPYSFHPSSCHPSTLLRDRLIEFPCWRHGHGPIKFVAQCLGEDLLDRHLVSFAPGN